jgi:TonB family protein
MCGGFLCAADMPVQFSAVRDQAVFTPLPEYYLSHLDDAYYAFHLLVDPRTGSVTNVRLIESSDQGYMKYRILEALRRWKFKPGAPPIIRVSFGMERVWRDDPLSDRHTKKVNDMLAPFLGKWAVYRGALPDYPSKPAWTNKRGTGVFELHVDKNGRVSKVVLKRSSGDAVFDQTAAAAFQLWYFRKGPVVVELPLSFILTPEKFSLYVAKNP